MTEWFLEAHIAAELLHMRPAEFRRLPRFERLEMMLYLATKNKHEEHWKQKTPPPGSTK